jgi:hypothetical protein
MYKKTFYIMIDEDLFPFYSINIQDNETLAENPLQQMLLTALSSNPVVVELQGITPALGTQWDGVSFENSIDEPVVPNMKNYSLVVNGKHFQYIGINLFSENGEMIAAALSSNPKIVGRVSVQ